MNDTAYETRLLTPATWDDFAALVETNNGVWGGCWCIGFHPEDRAVGWCRSGTPDEPPTTQNPRVYEKDLVELPRWRIGCIFTDGKRRGRGVARAAVTAVLEEVRQIATWRWVMRLEVDA